MGAPRPPLPPSVPAPGARGPRLAAISQHPAASAAPDPHLSQFEKRQRWARGAREPPCALAPVPAPPGPATPRAPGLHRAGPRGTAAARPVAPSTALHCQHLPALRSHRGSRPLRPGLPLLPTPLTPPLPPPRCPQRGTGPSHAGHRGDALAPNHAWAGERWPSSRGDTAGVPSRLAGTSPSCHQPGPTDVAPGSGTRSHPRAMPETPRPRSGTAPSPLPRRRPCRRPRREPVRSAVPHAALRAGARPGGRTPPAAAGAPGDAQHRPRRTPRTQKSTSTLWGGAGGAGGHRRGASVRDRKRLLHDSGWRRFRPAAPALPLARKGPARKAMWKLMSRLTPLCKAPL